MIEFRFLSAILAGVIGVFSTATATETFKDCSNCPEMVVVPSGSFIMGSPASELQRDQNEGPQHRVSFVRPFAVGKFAVTFDEWDACVADAGCNGYRPDERDWGRGRNPVMNVNWNEAKAYVTWLSRKAGKNYRLLSESEREYVTRAGTTTPFWWGSSISPAEGNYDGTYAYNDGSKGVYRARILPVDAFRANPWGLYQVHGNVWEWVEDCYLENYVGAPTDGSARTDGDCSQRIVRGGSYVDYPLNLRSADRKGWPSDTRLAYIGFRVGRTLAP